MARGKRKIWTVCYILYIPGDEDPDGDNWYSNSWFAYGRDKAEAKEDFLRYFEQNRENFWCGDDPRFEIHIANVFPGFSC